MCGWYYNMEEMMEEGIDMEKIKILEESPEEAEIGAKDTLSYLKNKYSNLSVSK